MPTAHANHAAAVTAGFKSVLTDRGSSVAPAVRYEVMLEKYLVGPVGRRGGPMRAYGVGSSQANAEAAAASALNMQRDHRYGKGAAGGSTSQDGQALTVDVS